jgi:hypothetical protein
MTIRVFRVPNLRSKTGGLHGAAVTDQEGMARSAMPGRWHAPAETGARVWDTDFSWVLLIILSRSYYH